MEFFVLLCQFKKNKVRDYADSDSDCDEYYQENRSLVLRQVTKGSPSSSFPGTDETNMNLFPSPEPSCCPVEVRGNWGRRASLESVSSQPEDSLQGQKGPGAFCDGQRSPDSGQTCRIDHMRCGGRHRRPWCWVLRQHYRFSRWGQSVTESHRWRWRLRCTWGPQRRVLCFWWGRQERCEQCQQRRSGQHQLGGEPQGQHQWDAQRQHPSEDAGEGEEGPQGEQDGRGGRGGGFRRGGKEEGGHESVVQCGLQQRLGPRKVQQPQVRSLWQQPGVQLAAVEPCASVIR